MKNLVANWGNYPLVATAETSFADVAALQQTFDTSDELIVRGNGRCYGDSSLSDRRIVSALKFDKVTAFDVKNGIITCQAGVTLADLLDIIVPQGWFLPVTPGTKFITVGGAVASDVHGKNHHVDGSFGQHVRWMDVFTGKGEIIRCSPEQHTDLFVATCGGMGLTGAILTVCFQLKKVETAYIRQRQIKARNLSEIISLFEQYKHATYSMAWIDCLKSGDGFGRSIMMSGEHATADELKSIPADKHLQLPPKMKLTVPFHFPEFVLNNFSVRVFNFLYYHKNYRRVMDSMIPYDGFFYPLDAIHHWNRMYGRSGFVQYQFVLPLEVSERGLTEILQRISKKGWGSFLAVLKLFGKQESLISFPMEGYTLALDFPVRKGLFQFLDELDRVVLDFGGRIYLTKDARMKPEVFQAGYPNIEEFLRIVRTYNPEGKFASLQSKRLFVGL
ncbi:FAD-binding protein [Rhodoflexus sp.]